MKPCWPYNLYTFDYRLSSRLYGTDDATCWIGEEWHEFGLSCCISSGTSRRCITVDCQFEDIVTHWWFRCAGKSNESPNVLSVVKLRFQWWTCSCNLLWIYFPAKWHLRWREDFQLGWPLLTWRYTESNLENKGKFNMVYRI